MARLLLRILEEERSRHLDQLIRIICVHAPENLLDIPSGRLGQISLPSVALDVDSTEMPLEAVEFPRLLQPRPGKVGLKNQITGVIDDPVLEPRSGESGVDEQICDQSTEVGERDRPVSESFVEKHSKIETSVSSACRVMSENVDQSRPAGEVLSDGRFGELFEPTNAHYARAVENCPIYPSARNVSSYRLVSKEPLRCPVDSDVRQPSPATCWNRDLRRWPAESIEVPQRSGTSVRRNSVGGQHRRQKIGFPRFGDSPMLVDRREDRPPFAAHQAAGYLRPAEACVERLRA